MHAGAEAFTLRVRFRHDGQNAHSCRSTGCRGGGARKKSRRGQSGKESTRRADNNLDGKRNAATEQRRSVSVLLSRTASSAEPVSIVVPAELQEPLRDFLNSYQQAPRNISTPQQLDEVEQQLATASDHLFSAAMQTVVQESVTSREPSKTRRGSLVPSWLRRLNRPKTFKNQGRRTVSVRLSRGSAISIRVVYYSRKCDRGQNREHKGCYPALVCLGDLRSP